MKTWSEQVQKNMREISEGDKEVQNSHCKIN